MVTQQNKRVDDKYKELRLCIKSSQIEGFRRSRHGKNSNWSGI